MRSWLRVGWSRIAVVIVALLFTIVVIFFVAEFVASVSSNSGMRTPTPAATAAATR